jgi:hypothetical protein
MPDRQQLKRRIVHTAQRLVVNPVGRRSLMTMLETTGRKSGQPRRPRSTALVRLMGSDLRTIRVDLD